MSSRLLDHIVTTLDKGKRHSMTGVNVKDWRISLAQSQLVSLGIKHNQGGGVYAPPAYKRSESADVFLIWDDGKCSKIKVNPTLNENADYWEDELKNWRMAAFADAYAAMIPAPAEIPDVEIAEEKIFEVINRSNNKIFEEQAWILSEHPPQAKTNGNITYYWGDNYLSTSTGIAAHYPESRYGISWSFDSIIAEGIAQRYLPSADIRNQLWQDSIFKYQVIQNQAQAVNAGTTVVLSPSVVEQMIDQFILYNFKGESILEGQSKFSQGDFSNNLKLFANELSIEVNPLQPREWGSYRLTAEGIPARRTTLVKNGMLASPFLNIKDSQRWGAEPTGIPAGSAGIKLKHIHQVNWSDTLKQIKDGVLILSVLGLHTQNPVQGSFSLAAPAALRIQDGVLTGKTDARINGNIWDIFKDQATQYASHVLYKQPYIITRCSAETM